MGVSRQTMFLFGRDLKRYTPQYVRARLVQMVFQQSNPGLPWLTRDAIRILESWMQPSHKGLELGSGRSTFWLAERVGSLVTVEHDPEWFGYVVKGLRERGIRNVEPILAEDESAYVSAILSQRDASLDFVLIDGEFRESCLRESLGKLKQSGMLIIDNVERYLLPPNGRVGTCRHQRKTSFDPVWSDFQVSAGSKNCIWTNDGVDCTAVYFPHLQSDGNGAC